MPLNTTRLLLAGAALTLIACAHGGGPPSSTGSSAPHAGMEQALHERINSVRREHQLDALRRDAGLDPIARGHSRRMAERGFFAHEDPQGSDLPERLRDAGIAFGRAAENIGLNAGTSDPVLAAIESWMRSPGHRDNILDPQLTHTGIGIWRAGETFYFTQVFLRPPSAR